MSDGFRKIILVIIYLIIILMIPIFLDYLFRLTVRKKRKNQILKLAELKSRETGKPVIIFNDRNHGTIITYTNNNSHTAEDFPGDIVDIIDKLETNSLVVIVSQTLEYIDGTKLIDVDNRTISNKKKTSTDLSWTIDNLKRVSGGDLYVLDIEKNSPRIFWDYKIKNIMDKSFYLPNENITWSAPNGLQLRTQKMYSYVFKILPYQFFAYDPVYVIKK